MGTKWTGEGSQKAVRSERNAALARTRRKASKLNRARLSIARHNTLAADQLALLADEGWIR
jgi:hypothetical protein